MKSILVLFFIMCFVYSLPTPPAQTQVKINVKGEIPAYKTGVVVHHQDSGSAQPTEVHVSRKPEGTEVHVSGVRNSGIVGSFHSQRSVSGTDGQVITYSGGLNIPSRRQLSARINIF